MYVYDAAKEVHNKVSLFSKDSNINETIVENLIDMLNANNAIVKSFWMARDKILEDVSTRL